MYLVTSEQMQAFDKHTIETLRVPGIVLMADAGKEVARVVARESGSSVCILCGKGNNGGDGYIAARWLVHWGWKVFVISIVDPETLTGDAKVAYQMAAKSGIRPIVFDERAELPKADVYVDALLGTSGRTRLVGLMKQLVSKLNQISACTIAIDVPSGVDASSGEVSGLAVKARKTVAIASQKLGTAVTPGCLYAGEVEVVDIGIPIESLSSLARATRPEDVLSVLPTREHNSHKGTFGKTAIVLGEMPGAVMLAGLSAYRVGAGYVALITTEDSPRNVPYEIVVRTCTTEDIHSVVADCASVVVGPGLGRSSGFRPEFFQLYQGKGVIDADGLFCLREPLEHSNWVLTPHPKECAQLLGWSVDEVQAKRIEAARTLAKQWNAVVVLKGYRSIITNPQGPLWVNTTGDASLAKAGTGDVLAGMVGGLLTQGLGPTEAAIAAVWLHGKAGELAGRNSHQMSALATDVIDNISRAISLCFDTCLLG